MMHSLPHFSIRDITCLKPQKVPKIALDLRLNLHASICNRKKLSPLFPLWCSHSLGRWGVPCPICAIRVLERQKVGVIVKPHRGKHPPKILLIVTFTITKLLNTPGNGGQENWCTQHYSIPDKTSPFSSECLYVPMT